MTKPSLAVWKLASCDGCQLTLLDCEDELLTLPGVVSIAHFLEASSAVQPGPYDISLVEGSITTARDAERIRRSGRSRGSWSRSGPVPRPGESRHCGTSAMSRSSPPRSTPAPNTSTPWPPPPRSRRTYPSTSSCAAARSTAGQLLEVLTAFLAGRKPAYPRYDRVHRVQAPGPHLRHGRGRDAVPRAGHARRMRGALPRPVPGMLRLFRPASGANVPALAIQLGRSGMGDDAIRRVFATFNAAAPGFADRNRDEPRQ